MTNSEKFLTQLEMLGRDVKKSYIRNTIEMNSCDYGEWYLYEKTTPNSFTGAFIFSKSEEGHRFWEDQLNKFEALTNHVPEDIKRLQVLLNDEERKALRHSIRLSAGYFTSEGSRELFETLLTKLQ